MLIWMLLDIKWYQFVWNDDVRRLTKQPKLTAMIQSCRLTLFGHIVRMDNNADANRILLASPPVDWRRQPGDRSFPHHVAQHRPTGSETAPPYDPRSSRFGSELPSVEDNVDVLRCAILDTSQYLITPNGQKFYATTTKYTRKVNVGLYSASWQTCL